MSKVKKRTFLDRAMEALKERYPNERTTQVRLAKIAGVSQPTVHEWGLPDRVPELPNVVKLAEELGVCVEWLYTERGPKRPAPSSDRDPLAIEWGGMDEATKRQLISYAQFLKSNPTKPQ